MLDVPGFVLAAVRDLCPQGACIFRLDKSRFRIQSRGTADLKGSKNQPVLELTLSESLIKGIQCALDQNDQGTLAKHTLYGFANNLGSTYFRFARKITLFSFFGF